MDKAGTPALNVLAETASSQDDSARVRKDEADAKMKEQILKAFETDQNNLKVVQDSQRDEQLKKLDDALVQRSKQQSKQRVEKALINLGTSKPLTKTASKPQQLLVGRVTFAVSDGWI